ncbi:hypothetical protein [Nocardia tengchongensis]
MAYLSSSARAASNGAYGEGGHGSLDTHWHNMPHASVEPLPIDDPRGEFEIRWAVGWFDRVLACLTVSEARVLRDKLTAAITEFEGSTSSVTDNDVSAAVTVNDDGAVASLENEPMFCQDCGGRLSLLSNGIDYWWTHEPHSINDHEPRQNGPVLCRVCGGQIRLVTSFNDRWWVHIADTVTDDDPLTDHDAVPGLFTGRRSGEAA